MRRLKVLLVYCVAATMLATGCSSKSDNTDAGITKPGIEEQDKELETEGKGIVYSNMVDDKTKEEIKTKLQNAGVQKKGLDTYFSLVEDFNKRVGKPNAFQDGFQYNENQIVDYSDVILDGGVQEDGPPKMDTNCRLAAYLLMEPYVTVNKVVKDIDNYLMFDMDSIDTDPRFELIKETRDKFITLYNPIEVVEGTTINDHIKRITQEWDNRGIEFQEDSKLSLITLLMHDPYENKRFVGHVGVLIEDGSSLLFIEKYGPDYPFQCTKFDDEAKVSQYLLSRTDIYGDGTEELPIVMRNKRPIS